MRLKWSPAERLAIERLKQGPVGTPELAKELGIHYNSARKIITHLLEQNVIVKDSHRNGVIVYTINHAYRRNEPFLQGHNDNGVSYTNIPQLLIASGVKEHRYSKATLYLGEAAARLAYLGMQYATMLASNDLPEREVKKLQRELRATKSEFIKQTEVLQRWIDVYDQLIAQPEFWSLSELARYFDEQKDAYGNLIPSVDRDTVIQARQHYAD